jgi:hypothetical protein
VGTIGIPSWTAAKLVGHNGLAMWLLRIIFLPRNPPIYRWECQCLASSVQSQPVA